MSNLKIKEFPSEVITELSNYVYRLIDPRNGETFYVGKGKGNRVFEHIKKNIKEGEDEDELNLKYKRIQEIKNTGLEVIHIIHRHGLTNETALHVEAALIDAYPGITNIAGGSYSNELGSMNAFEILKKHKSEIADLKHNVLMITINRSINDLDIYDAVRFAWRIDIERAKKADYILALEKGIIVGVFKALEWHLARKQYFPEFTNHTNSRYGFIGEEASDDIKQLYMNKRIPSEYSKKGAAYPLKYNYPK